MSSGGDEWPQKWRSIPVARRRRIARAVARGEAVTDPRDAALALELIEKRERNLHRATATWLWKWLSPRHLLIFSVLGLVGGLLIGDFVIVAVAAATPLYVLAMRMFFRRLETRTALAREANERLPD